MKVTLKKDHTHADIPYKAGDEIEVRPVDAAWLAAHKIIDQPAKKADKAAH